MYFFPRQRIFSITFAHHLITPIFSILVLSILSLENLKHKNGLFLPWFFLESLLVFFVSHEWVVNISSILLMSLTPLYRVPLEFGQYTHLLTNFYGFYPIESSDCVFRYKWDKAPQKRWETIREVQTTSPKIYINQITSQKCLCLINLFTLLSI